MLTTFTRIKIVAFVLIAIVTLAYIATNYAELGRYLGVRDYYTVRLQLPQTGGLFKGSAVSYRGVTVGKVNGLRLDPAANGVVAELHLDKSAAKIPSDLSALVANRSAVGEQYVDLRPNVDAGPYLSNGSQIDRARTTTPQPVTTTLKSINDLAASVPLDDLRTVVHELGQAYTGTGPRLQQLLDASDRFINTADANLDTTVTFLDNGEAVLRTQNEEAAALLTLSRETRRFAAALRGSDADLRYLIKVTPPAATALSKLLHELDPGLPRVFANLLTNARLTAPRQAALAELLSDAPALVSITRTVVGNGTVNISLVNTFFNPLPCVRGYAATSYRNGLDTSKPLPFNTRARCTMAPSTGVNVRGAANAPRQGVPEPARPPGWISRSQDPGTDLTDDASTDLARLLGLLPGGVR